MKQHLCTTTAGLCGEEKELPVRRFRDARSFELELYSRAVTVGEARITNVLVPCTSNLPQNDSGTCIISIWPHISSRAIVSSNSNMPETDVYS